MSFENPWMLFGLLGALIPIVLHLTNRRRAERRPFAALDFLLLSDKRLARRLKTKQLLVMCLRTLLLAAIPLALSKPYLSYPHEGGLDTASPGSVVIVLDNSLSMRRTVEGESLFEKAVAEARQIIDNAGPQTNLAILTTAKPVKVWTEGLTYDRSELFLAAAQVRPSQASGNAAKALSEAERLLSTSEFSLRQVVILTDLAAGDWSGITKPWSLKEIPAVVIEPLGAEHPPENVAITETIVAARPMDGQGAFSATVHVANLGEESVTTSVVIKLAGDTLRKQVSVSANETKEVSFEHQVKARGEVAGVALLDLDDDLADDNRHFFTVDLGAQLNVLLVNGAPRDERYLDELFFLKPSLEPDDGSIACRSVTQTELKPEILQGVDVVYLANVGGLSPQQRLALTNFIQQGGGLFIAPGDQLSEKSVKTYGDLLPAPIRSFKEVVRRRSPSADARALRIATVRGDHPLMAEFGRTSLFRSLVYQYALLSSEALTDEDILARYSNGVPALVESRQGQGRILMLTTTLDRDWADLAMRSSFLPLMQMATKYLGHRLGTSGRPKTRVGQTISLREPSGKGDLIVQGPDGIKTAVSPDSRGLVRFVGTRRAGNYELQREGTRTDRVAFSVNIEPTESDLRRAELEQVEEALRTPGTVNAPQGTIIARPGSDVPDPSRSNIWPLVLIALFALLFAETWVVIRALR